MSKSGLPLVFSKKFSGIQISFRFLKVHIFGTIFNLKLSLMYKTVLNSIKTLKKYCKVTLNLYFNKKKFMMTTNKTVFIW